MTSLFRQDMTNALRDNIIIYMIIAPLLLALGARLFLPGLEDIQVTFAVAEAVETAVVERLAQYGQIEQYPTREEVVARVERADDVPGVVLDGDTVTVLLEGNEPEGEVIANVIMQEALRGERRASYTYNTESNGRSALTQYGAVVLIMMGVMLGAMVTAFVMIDEKETRAFQALSVSPLRMIDYTAARGLFAMAISFLLVTASSLIMVGTAVSYTQLIIGFLFSSGIAITLGYIVGGFADNQLSAGAIIKVLMAAYLSLPIISIFVPANWQFVFYPLPNYWMFKIFENIYVGQIGPVGFWGACLLTLVESLILLAALFPFLKKRIKLR